MKNTILLAIIFSVLGSISPGGRASAAESPAAGALEAVKADEQIQQAKADLMGLHTGLLSFKLLAGDYPTAEQGLKSLIEKPTTEPVPKRWNQIMKKIPIDPWGREYRYVVREKDGKTLHFIVSDGPDPDSEKDDIERALDAEKK